MHIYVNYIFHFIRFIFIYGINNYSLYFHHNYFRMYNLSLLFISFTSFILFHFFLKKIYIKRLEL